MKLRVSLALMGAIAGVVTALALSQESNSNQNRVTSHGSYLGFATAEEMVYEADGIVIAEFVRQEDDQELLDSGPPPMIRYEVVRTYRVEEVLKGEISAGIDLTIPISTELEMDGALARLLPLNPVEKGQSYLLFLQVIPYKGGETWALNGTPSEAVMQSDESLKFLTSQHYQESMQAKGKPIRGSGAPFELTLSQLRALITRNAAPSTPVIQKEVGTPIVGTTPLPTITPQTGPSSSLRITSR